MKRTLIMLAVVALLVVALAMPAFAQGRSETAPNCSGGILTATNPDNQGSQVRSGKAFFALSGAFRNCGDFGAPA